MVEYRTLGRTGLDVSSLCLGGDHFGIPGADRYGEPAMRGCLDGAATEAMIARALDGGINVIDTAESYNGGRSEEAIGAALQRLGKRTSTVVATKVRLAGEPDSAPLSRAQIVAACEASLRRLRTDYIDLYQVHRLLPGTPLDETLRALDDLVRSGKVRSAGICNAAAWQLVESVWMADQQGLARVAATQPAYNLLDRRIERELLPAAQAYGIGVMVWSPIGGGLLGGHYRRGQPPPAGSRFSTKDTAPGSFLGQLYARRWGGRTFDVIEGCEAVAREIGIPLPRLALAWCAGQPGIASAIIGPRTMGHLEDSLEAAGTRLTADTRAAIDAVIAPGDHATPFYEP